MKVLKFSSLIESSKENKETLYWKVYMNKDDRKEKQVNPQSIPVP
jgi:hypothetical protein